MNELESAWPVLTAQYPDMFPKPATATVEQIASRIRQREHYARNKKQMKVRNRKNRMRLKAAVLTAEGKL